MNAVDTSVIKVFGDFVEDIPATQEYLTIGFSPRGGAWRQRWSTNGISADFLGDYFATFFPGDELLEGRDRQETVKASVSYLANELLENAMKYGSTEHPVSISLYLYVKEIIFVVSNSAAAEVVQKYQAFIEQVQTTDINELYLKQLELAASGGGGSGIGILTLINDYAARFSWKFELLANSSLTRVTVMAHLDLEAMT